MAFNRLLKDGYICNQWIQWSSLRVIQFHRWPISKNPVILKVLYTRGVT